MTLPSGVQSRQNLPGTHHACLDDFLCRQQLRLDQLQQHLCAGKLLGEFYGSAGWRDCGPAKNVPGLLITDIDPGQLYYDSTQFWRKRAMDGIYYSGEAIADERSEQRDAL